MYSFLFLRACLVPCWMDLPFLGCHLGKLVTFASVREADQAWLLFVNDFSRYFGPPVRAMLMGEWVEKNHSSVTAL